MVWPSHQDYQIAIQNPANCFSDPKLRAGIVVKNKLGMPHGISGGFAIVFQVNSNHRSYAARCFVKGQDYLKRYSLLDNHLAQLAQVRIQSLVGFKFLERGIWVNGEWHPIVKMEWISGQTLDKYIESHVHNSPDLQQVAKQLRSALTEWQSADLAHGDLQHGNIIIDGDGKLRFVDYDCVYVPDLAGNLCPEEGLPSYQHPDRHLNENNRFNKHLGNFSAIVIYLSLLAVASDPSLWKDFHNNDNKLILDAGDFSSRGQTQIWRRLKSSPSAEVQRLTDALEGYCCGPVSGAPGLETVLAGSFQKMTVKEWQKLAETVAARPKSPAVTMIPSDWTKLKKLYEIELKARQSSQAPPILMCVRGHTMKDASQLYCLECAKVIQDEKRSWTYGPRPCPMCGREIPDKSKFCPECGRPTHW